MKNIDEYLKYIYGLERKGTKYDLTKIARLLTESGNPHTGQKYIHIAGTNGKGGTASFLCSILMEHGLKTGLFTSPHILKFNERIKIDGKNISNSYITKYLSENLKLIKKIKASFFEINTALALNYFADKKIDVAVIETGLGGRLDATNIIKPELVIITQLGLEHTDMLGHTLKKIAKEKMGIIKPGVDVIVSDDHRELRSMFLKKVPKSALAFLDDLIDLTIGEKLTSPLPGEYQIRNAATAILAAQKYLKQNGIRPDDSKIRKGIDNVIINAGYHGRFESITKDGIEYIFDVAHNPGAIENSVQNLKYAKADVIIFALMSDKDYKTAVKFIFNGADNFVFTRPENNRAQDPKLLFDYAVRNSKIRTNRAVSKQFFCVYNVAESLEISRKIAKKGGKILIIGSFFLISEAVKILRLNKYFN